VIRLASVLGIVTRGVEIVEIVEIVAVAVWRTNN
jgi:hypothetical protein